MAENKSSRRDSMFGLFSLELGFLKRSQLDAALQTQRDLRRNGTRQSLAKVLYVSGLLSEKQVKAVRRAAAVHTGDATRIGEYEIIRKIGEGAMGWVYKVRRVGTKWLAAIKVLPPKLATDDLVKRFRREAEIASGLNHRNIVRYLEFGYDETHKCWFCALELIEGEDLSNRLDRLGRIPEKETTGIARDIGRALEHAWANGLVHRDVKPKNIMIAHDGRAMLLDLGLARPAELAEKRAKGPRMFRGTVSYASPEQARGLDRIDVRSDIYSLGVTLYHCLTGKRPFTGKTSLEVLRKHVEQEPPHPAKTCPGISDEMCQMIRVMMAKDPGDRYDDPTQFLRDLETFA